jgi:hypothetical protein
MQWRCMPSSAGALVEFNTAVAPLPNTMPAVAEHDRITGGGWHPRYAR